MHRKNLVRTSIIGFLAISTLGQASAAALEALQGAWTMGGTDCAAIFKSAGGISGAVSLTGTLNSIGTITGVTAQNLTIVDNHDLTLAGLVSVGESE